MKIQVAEYAPDQPPLTPGVTDRAFNVLPLTRGSYGPWRGLEVYSSALTARCQGALAVKDRSSNVNVFAGDAAKLYRLLGSSAFTDVSGAAYTTGAEEGWGFTQFGERIIATNRADVPQSFEMGVSATFAALIATGVTTLRARYVATVKDWVFFLNTEDATDGVRPQRVWWSAVDDPTNFPTPGTTAARTAQSDYQDVVGPHGAARGIVGNLGNADAALFFEQAVFRVEYVGPPAIFAVRIAEGARGCPASKSIVQRGSECFYLGEDGFYRFDGVNSTPIGEERVNRFFFNDVDNDALHLVSGAADPTRPIIYWAYPRSGVSYCNRILAYNIVLNRWSITDIDAVLVELLLPALSVGVTVDTLPGNLDSYPQNVDDRQFTGGRLSAGAFDTGHKLGYFSGAYLAPSVDTEEANILDGRVSVVTGVRALVDGAAPSVAIGARSTLVGSPTFGDARSPEPSGVIPARATGRYHKARLSLPAASVWSHISGVEIDPSRDVRPAGSR